MAKDSWARNLKARCYFLCATRTLSAVPSKAFVTAQLGADPARSPTRLAAEQQGPSFILVIISVPILRYLLWIRHEVFPTKAKVLKVSRCAVKK